MPTDEDKFCQYCIFPCNDLPSDHETSMYNAKGLLHMKKLLLVVVCLYMFVYDTYAQSPEIRTWEAEIGAGIAFGGNKLNFDHTYPGASFLMEGRYNFTRLPIDVGLQIHTNLLNRESEHAKKMNFKSWNILVVSDYNVFRTSRVSLFAGAGFGYAFDTESAPASFDNTQSDWSGLSSTGERHDVCFMPRIGAEFFHHIRTTFDYRLQEKANRHFTFTLGFVFGGGRK